MKQEFIEEKLLTSITLSSQIKLTPLVLRKAFKPLQ